MNSDIEGLSDDIELARACASGDVSARRRLVREYHPHLMRFFGNKVPQTLVGDLVNDTFIRLFDRCLGAYGGQGRLRCFILGVAYRRALEHFRDGARIVPRERPGATSDRGPSPSRLSAQRRRRRGLCEALRRLPCKLQTSLELYYWNGLTTEEIAAVVGRPIGTVRWELRRARELLKELLEAVEFDAAEWIEMSSTSPA